MLRVIDRGPVRELEMATRVSQALGYKVSAFVHRGFLIDTGFSRAADQLLAWLDRHPVSGAVITHWHEDHAGNLARLVERGLPVAVSADTLARHRAMPRVPAYRWLTWGHPRPSPRDPAPAEHPFELIATPGHSPDHLAVYDPEDRIVFTGDLFLGVKAVLSHADESPAAIVASVRRVRALEPRVVLDAHRGPLADPLGLLDAKADWLEATIAAIERAIAAGQPDPVIVRELLGGEDRTALVTFGQISKRNFVAAVRTEARSRAAG